MNQLQRIFRIAGYTFGILAGVLCATGAAIDHGPFGVVLGVACAGLSAWCLIVFLSQE